MTGIHSRHTLLPFPVIVAAAQGEPNAIEAVIRHYDRYISTLCTKTLKDDLGNAYTYVDPYMRRRLETKLISRILKFKVV